jgi:hypothetical protein
MHHLIQYPRIDTRSHGISFHTFLRIKANFITERWEGLRYIASQGIGFLDYEMA